MSAFVLSKIFPSMNIDASQRFIFGLEGSPEPLGSFKLDNIFVPTMGSPSFTNFEMRNEALSGYRWIHGTASDETYGSFKLQKFLEGSPTGIDIITINDDGSFVFPGTTDAKYIIQTANANLPNAQSLGALTTGLLKNTVTTGTGVLSTAVPGTDYATLSHRLDQFAAPNVSLNLNSQKIINLLDPTNAQDGATKAYVDSKSVSIGDAKFIIQTADADLPNAQILGSLATGILKNTTTTGVLSIATAGTDYATLGNRLDQFAPPIVSLNLNSQKIINLANPTGSNDAVNRTYLDARLNDIATAPFIIQTADVDLINAQVLGVLATGILKNTTTTGVLSIAVAGTDYYSLNNPTKIIDSAVSQNVSMGRQALQSLTSGAGNAIFGGCGLSITTGSTNSIFGSNTGNALTTGNSNAIFGEGSGVALTTGNTNLLMGGGGGQLTTASFNVFLGSEAGGNLQTGSGRNVGVGVQAGLWNGGGFATYNNCVFLGDQATAGASNLSNAVAIGAGTTVLTSNSMVLGTGLNVGIGLNNPTLAKLIVSGGPTNVASENSVIRALGSNNATKIEIENNSGSGKLYELRSDNAGAFSIFDRTAVASRLFINTSGNIGLNMTSSILAKLHVTGGVQNVTNEDSCIRATSSSNSAKIELQCTNGSGKLHEIHSANSGGLHFYDRTANASRLFINTSGLVGINTFTATSAQLVVNGGVQNIANEDSIIRATSSANVAKIELQCTNGSGKLYEFRSANDGALSVVDRTGSAVRFFINTSGQIGIGGLTTPHAALQFPNVVTNRQLVLYEAANNNFQFHGFGSIAGGLGYNVNDVGDSHVFFAGVNSTTRNELARFTGTGDCIIADTFYGKSPSGTCYMQANATATAVTAGTWTKIAGTTSSASLNKFTMPANNRLQYTGTPTVNAIIVASVTAYHNVGAGAILGFSLFKNGVEVVPSSAFNQTALSIISNTCVITIVSLATNDYIEVYGNSSANANITVSNLTLDITTT